MLVRVDLDKGRVSDGLHSAQTAQYKAFVLMNGSGQSHQGLHKSIDSI